MGGTRNTHDRIEKFMNVLTKNLKGRKTLTGVGPKTAGYFKFDLKGDVKLAVWIRLARNAVRWRVRMHIIKKKFSLTETLGIPFKDETLSAYQLGL